MNSFIESDFGKGFLICLKKPCAPPLACVYAFEMSDSTVKIGVTQDVEERVKSVSRAKCQDVLRIYSTELAPLDFMRIIEARCHAAFATRRERGEYFAITFEEAVAELDKYADEIADALHKADRIYLDEVDYYYNVFLPEFNSTYNNPSIILTPQVLSHPKFGALRIVIIDNTAWFVGKDVAAALGYAKPADAVRDHVPDKFKYVCRMSTPGGKQDVVAINEAGLYKLVMRSRLPEAEKFSDWACGEVLPSINKHGYYSTKPAVNAERIEQRVKKQLSTVSKCEFAVVYLLFLSNLTVKIGYTGDLTQRVKQIQSETGLEVLNFKTTAYMPLDEARALEAKLKEKYAVDCIGGEFYDVRFTDLCKEI